MIEDEFHNQFYLATPERAINAFDESWRLQNIDQLKPQSLEIISAKFQSPRLTRLINLLTQNLRSTKI